MGEVIQLFGGPGAQDPEPARRVGRGGALPAESLRDSSAADGAAPAEPAAPGRAGAPGGIESEAPAEPLVFSPIEEVSLRALGRRGMSRRELERELARAGFHEFAIADELDRLESVGLIDDFALAQHLVAHLQERKQLTGSAIKAELVKRVIAPGAIEYAMDLVDTGDELAQARELAQRRARQYGGLDRAVVDRRLTAYLLRRGFTPSTVRAAVADAVRLA